MTQTWSKRFDGTLHPAIVEFNASIGFDIQLIEYDLTGSIAHAQMLAHTGIITAGAKWSLVLTWKTFTMRWKKD
jgi:argininosuccinate lyase